ncbi:uncharacterized protein SPSK_00937 [Sporothrix schenckii 1099-18]|uniref:Uncharacterized protein n=1 Tax=Sporothrix schenckii 1099-18 TaxID=1397361 RepID=A0A0F2LY12_SPOSC|nr:uncharacterized protein SPSK_00937 [Sporothrix schenckii 1099-18]KJR81729.1 hypothetical protein SPSK_00937 [Sporothrix schenckii 1099-18]
MSSEGRTLDGKTHPLNVCPNTEGTVTDGARRKSAGGKRRQGKNDAAVNSIYPLWKKNPADKHPNIAMYTHLFSTPSDNSYYSTRRFAVACFVEFVAQRACEHPPKLHHLRDENYGGVSDEHQ